MHFHGFAWGVSATDSLTPGVHALMSRIPRRDWRQYPDESADPGHAAHEWLRSYLMASGEGPLDVDGDPIATRYRHLAAPESTSASTDPIKGLRSV